MPYGGIFSIQFNTGKSLSQKINDKKHFVKCNVTILGNKCRVIKKFCPIFIGEMVFLKIYCRKFLSDVNFQFIENPPRIGFQRILNV